MHRPRVVRRAGNRWKRYLVDFFDDRRSPARSEQGVARLVTAELKLSASVSRRRVTVIYAYECLHETPATFSLRRVQSVQHSRN